MIAFRPCSRKADAQASCRRCETVTSRNPTSAFLIGGPILPPEFRDYIAARVVSGSVNRRLGGETERNVLFALLSPDEADIGIAFGLTSIDEAAIFNIKLIRRSFVI